MSTIFLGPNEETNNTDLCKVKKQLPRTIPRIISSVATNTTVATSTTVAPTVATTVAPTVATTVIANNNNSIISSALLESPVENYSWNTTGIYKSSNGKIWYLPNHLEYSNWVNQEFIGIFDHKTHNEHETPLFNYQKFIKSYMCPESPYRGLLLNHHMGSGKSRTAIITAEQFRQAGYKMIFLVPASLRDNAIAEIRKWALPDLSYPANYSHLTEEQKSMTINQLNQKIMQEYQFISYNSSRVLQELRKVKFEKAFILIDEAHDLISMMTNEHGKTGKLIYYMLMKTINCRILMLSGTPPPINYPYELGLMFNILRGYMTDPITGKQHTAFPEDRETFDDIYIDYKTKRIRNIDLFKKRAIGLTSFYHGADRDLYPDVIHQPLEKVFMDDMQFDGYRRARNDEIIRESKRTGRRSGPNTFRPNSRQFCNFGLPPQIDRPISLNKLKKITFQDPKLSSFPYKWTAEQIDELNDLFFNIHEFGLTDKNETAEQMFESFKKKWTSYRDPIARLTYLIELIDLSGQVGKYEHITNRKEEAAVLEPDENRNCIETALHQLSTEFNNYLQIDKDLGKCSQKHLRMHNNIDNGDGNDGPIFVYSNFRTMEGIEIFSRELDERGYCKYRFDDPSPGQRYAILSGQEPIALRTQILEYYNHPRNINGTYLRILLGTSASAQGLSLQNCRQVHIMEPWWTMVLLMQVIGRACRIRSHHSLPPEKRKVYVYQYISCLTESQKQLMSPEEAITTDQYLMQKAIEKDQLNQQCYTLLKEIAIDYVISAKENKPLENGIKNITVIHRTDKYNYLPNLTRESIPISDAYLELVTNNTETKGSANIKLITSEKRYVTLTVGTEKYIYFINSKNQPLMKRIKFKGEKTLLRVIEMYDFNSLKFSNKLVLRVYVDEKNKKWDLNQKEHEIID